MVGFVLFVTINKNTVIKNFKKGEEVECVNNYGMSILKLGKKYTVLKAYLKHIVVINGVHVFSSRFTNQKMERRRKLLKLRNEHKNL